MCILHRLILVQKEKSNGNIKQTSIQILKLLLKNKECMTGDNLAVAIGVSSRTIRNDMKDLNRALEDHGASVVSEIGQGYYLKIEDQEKF